MASGVTSGLVGAVVGWEPILLLWAYLVPVGVALATDKTPRGYSRPLRESAVTQSLVAQAAAGDGSPPRIPVASGRLDALAGLRPATVATYDSTEAGAEVDVVTMADTELDPVVAELVSRPDQVVIDGRPGLAFSGETEREFVAWEPTERTLVVVAGPTSLGRDALVALAAQAQPVAVTSTEEG